MDYKQLPDFSQLHILVIGDVMIDRYVIGNADRISPEAPVPVLNVHHTEDRLGGAANVCANIIAMGSRVTCLSIVGNDIAGATLRQMMSSVPKLDSTLYTSSDRLTTVKTRLISGSQQLLRMDSESKNYLEENEISGILTTFKGILRHQKIDGIILQDYNKGLLASHLITEIISEANKAGIPTFVDPKEKNFWVYKNCTLFKPNLKEIEGALNQKIAPNHSLHNIINEKLSNEISIVTLGKEGIYYGSDENYGIAPARSRVIADVCGAGDTVISLVALCYCSKMPVEFIAKIANIAGGQVCEVPGVAVIDLDKLKSEFVHQA
jgi:rfaE bifunctional protein kinase chain/domain